MSSVDHTLRALTAAALKASYGNRTAAAKKLGISIRTLRNWIKKYELESEVPPPRSRPPRR